MPSLTPAAATDLFRQDSERFLDVGDGEVAYRRVGAGPDVLLVHGWPVSGATFRTLLPYLADEVTCHLIDLPGTGSSRFGADTTLTIDGHIRSVQRVLDLLELEDIAVVGHDSGGLIARHAVAGDPRLRSMGLINTEQPKGLSWRFKSFIAVRHLPGVGRGLGWVVGQPRIRRNPFVLGSAFADSSLLDGEFDEFFLEPLHSNKERRDAAIRILRSFDVHYVSELAGVHGRIKVPVQLVWGDQDPFFPLEWAQEMFGTFADAKLAVVHGAGLFAHEERPAEVAQAFLPVLTAAR